MIDIELNYKECFVDKICPLCKEKRTKETTKYIDYGGIPITSSICIDCYEDNDLNKFNFIRDWQYERTNE